LRPRFPCRFLRRLRCSWRALSRIRSSGLRQSELRAELSQRGGERERERKGTLGGRVRISTPRLLHVYLRKRDRARASARDRVREREEEKEDKRVVEDEDEGGEEKDEEQRVLN
jgi:hypothetical protein